MTEPTKLDLKALGIMTTAEIQDDEFARVLLLGLPKTGKTTMVVSTAPGPVLHINCDGRTASAYARNHKGATPLEISVTSPETWKKGVENACKLACAGGCRTIALDSVSLLADMLVDKLGIKHTGHELWREVQALLVNGIRKLATVPAHLFVIAHYAPPQKDDEPSTAGVLPLIGGASKHKIPALLNDWVMFDAVPPKPPATEPERRLLVGPQKFWSSSGRNARRSVALPADACALLDELKIKH